MGQGRSRQSQWTQEVATEIAARYFTGKPCKNGHIAERWVRTHICIACALEHRQRYRKENPEAHRKSSREYSRRNRQEETKRHANWRKQNKDKRAAWLSEYRKSPIIAAGRAAEASARRAAKRHACPSWVNRSALADIYVEARRRSQETGIKHHVDHIVPLVNERVCGLHVPWNLQILTAEENLQKSNSFPADAPV